MSISPRLLPIRPFFPPSSLGEGKDGTFDFIQLERTRVVSTPTIGPSTTCAGVSSAVVGVVYNDVAPISGVSHWWAWDIASGVSIGYSIDLLSGFSLNVVGLVFLSTVAPPACNSWTGPTSKTANGNYSIGSTFGRVWLQIVPNGLGQGTPYSIRLNGP